MGLLNETAAPPMAQQGTPAPQQPPAPMQPPANGPTPPQGQGGPPPQQQQAGPVDFKKATKMASQILYDKGVFDGLADAYEKDPVEALAGTTVMIVRKVEEQLGPLAMDQLFAMAMMMIVDVADTVQQATGEEADAEVVTEGLSEAVSMYLQQHPNKFSKEELEAGVMELQKQQAAAQQAGPPQEPGAEPPPGAMGPQPEGAVA